MKYKRESSRVSDTCDGAKCKSPSTIILSYIKKYESGRVELCDACYDSLLASKEPNHVIHDKKDIVDSPEIITLERYNKVYGKRFRMTKDQKQRGLSRDQAFREFNENIQVYRA
jgi:hypothetical protein